MGLFKRGVGILTLILPLVALALFLPAAPAHAHNWNYCSDGYAIRWNAPSTSIAYPSTWPQSYQDAVVGAVVQFNKSDFDYVIDSQSSAKAQWSDTNNTSNTSLAAYTSLRVDCGVHQIYNAYFTFNFAHYNAAAHTTGQKQCVAIHEQGHGVGFHHNELVSILRTSERVQCHDNLWNTLQSHDYSDINGRY